MKKGIRFYCTVGLGCIVSFVAGYVSGSIFGDFFGSLLGLIDPAGHAPPLLSEGSLTGARIVLLSFVLLILTLLFDYRLRREKHDMAEKMTELKAKYVDPANVEARREIQRASQGA
jgi:hypothetical protein